jgi:hypothetical protein
VLELCAAADFPPCLMMRRMLEHMLGLSKQVRQHQGGQQRKGRRGRGGTAVHVAWPRRRGSRRSRDHPPPYPLARARPAARSASATS